MASKPRYVVLDIETTGLDPNKECILEIGAIAIDEKLHEVGAFHTLVPAPQDSYLNGMSQYVLDMHKKSGLYDLLTVDEFGEEGNGFLCVDEKLEAWLRSLGFEGKDVTLAGHTIGFDHRFVQKWLPQVGTLLSHRSLDFSALGILMNEAGYEIKFVAKDAMPHRAMPDAIIELDEFRSMVAQLNQDREDASKYRDLCR